MWGLRIDSDLGKKKIIIIFLQSRFVDTSNTNMNNFEFRFFLLKDLNISIQSLIQTRFINNQPRVSNLTHLRLTLFFCVAFQ